MRFALLGYGRFGQAFAQLLQQAGHDVGVFDPHATVPEPLARRSISDAVQDAEWVVLAMPVPRLAQALVQLRPHLREEQTVIDVGSVKQQPCLLMDELLGKAFPHAGTHPLFGPLSLARGEYPLRVVVCASALHPEVAARTCRLWESLGCQVSERNPADHDQAMAYTHAMAFFIAKALVEMGIGEDLSLAPPSFLGLANMLAAVRGDAGHLFAAIQRENPYAAEARAALLDHLTDIHRRLSVDDGGAMIIPDAPDESA